MNVVTLDPFSITGPHPVASISRIGAHEESSDKKSNFIHGIQHHLQLLGRYSMHKKTLLAAALVTALSASANAATFHFTGNITYNTDVIRTTFTLDSDATNVRIWTDSFQSGTNFDPITGLWNASTGALLGQNDDNPLIQAGQTYYDSGMVIPLLAAGTYWFTIAAYSNFASGPNYSDGFGFDGQSPIAIANWCQPASNNCQNQKGTYWSLWLDGVSSAVDPNQVPEPTALSLIGLGLAGLVSFRRRKTL
ncbi:MAG TPA: DVUA0089 family protein [Accumulibacter sp.]|nr:DVUA0089 family protein [Accumulibacter sp.]HMY05993.1 DVUA0089 family protein [Accumulibacter sp.]HNC18472.1 DVUA0089 family protein [Accumulibacter sp.]HND80831.1 DVUA0089 family protein [Accumulibacter sp.]HNE11948.1 DVUA0089 family protein [Accumulibacter sp.]